MEIAKAKVANALTSAASDHVIAVTIDVYDETQGDYQSNINQNLIDEIEELKSSGGTPSGDLSEYAKIAYVDDEVQKAKDYTDEEIAKVVIGDIDLSDYATIEYVNNKIADMPSGGGGSSYQGSDSIDITNNQISVKKVESSKVDI